MLGILLLRIPLGTFNDPSMLDTIAHFVLPATAAPLIVAIFQASSLLPYLRPAAFALVSTMVGVASEALWEIVEFAIDSQFNTVWQLSNTDTMTDIILAVIGALTGTLLFQWLYTSKNAKA